MRSWAELINSNLPPILHPTTHCTAGSVTEKMLRHSTLLTNVHVYERLPKVGLVGQPMLVPTLSLKRRF